MTRVATELCKDHSKVIFEGIVNGRLKRRELHISQILPAEYRLTFYDNYGNEDKPNYIFEDIVEAMPVTWTLLFENSHVLQVTVPALTTSVVGTFARFLIDQPALKLVGSVPVEVVVTIADHIPDGTEDLDDEILGPFLLNVRTGEMRELPAEGSGGGGRSKRSRRHRTPRQAPARKQTRSRRRHGGSHTPAFRRTPVN
jgi:hypothetical protein